MAANANFSVKVTLEEANDIRLALAEKLARLHAMSIREMSKEEKEQAGRIETMLRRDFG